MSIYGNHEHRGEDAFIKAQFEIARLKAEVERLTKAGNAFISVGVKMREMIGDHHWTLEFDRVRTDWYFASKEGKQS